MASTPSLNASSLLVRTAPALLRQLLNHQCYQVTVLPGRSHLCG